MKTKYFLYARKSTEDEERQIKSIEDQLSELKQYAKLNKLRISRTFIENKSAKKPGRPVFNEMIQNIYESKDPIGLLAWHPDRLARNSVDGGQIVYLIDIKKVVSLKFPTFWFEPTPQGLFMLQVSFSQSKYYSDNLAENVSRGLRQKVKRGEWPTFAPFGYNNNPVTRNIEPNPFTSKLVKTAFEEFSTGNYSLESLSQHLHFLGLTTQKGTVLSKSVIHYILSNPAYIGLIRYKGELFEGKFKPVITKELWDKVQAELKRRSRPRRRKNTIYFPFIDLFKCGECGCMITAQYAKQRKYTYYRCTKKREPCNQAYVRDSLMLKQLKDFLNDIAISAKCAEIMLTELERINIEDEKHRKSHIQHFKKQIKNIDKQLNKLVNTYLEGIINKKTFIKKKEELLIEKIGLQEEIAKISKKGKAYAGLVRDFIENAFFAGRLASSDNWHEIKQFIKKISNNRYVINKNVIIEVKSPFDFVHRYLQKQKSNINKSEEAKNELIGKTIVLDDRKLCLELLNEAIVFFHQRFT